MTNIRLLVVTIKKQNNGKKSIKKTLKTILSGFFAVNAVMPCQSQYALRFLEVKKVSKGINPSVEYFVSKVKKNYLGFFIYQKYGKLFHFTRTLY